MENINIQSRKYEIIIIIAMIFINDKSNDCKKIFNYENAQIHCNYLINNCREEDGTDLIYN